MAELGYKRSAKKCKEKFENVHKYYKRTKEGRAGRHDGKAYKFFSELEALQAVTSSSPPPPPPLPQQPMLLAPSPVSVGFQARSVPLAARFGNPASPASLVFTAGVAARESSPLGLRFSSNSSSLSPGSGDDEDDDGDDVEGEPSTAGSSRKRKKAAEASTLSGGRRMMEYFEGLMKRVMQQQEEMQMRFLEAVEKREQDRLAREESWRRQEAYRLAREHELVAQERAASASRDAAIMSYLQRITGQTIHLPAMPVAAAAVPVASPSPPSRTQPQQQPTQTYQPTHLASREVIAAVPEQQVRPPPQREIIGTSGGGGEAPSSSRWPKAEVLALIQLRSGMESKYVEAGPKGPLWEEISAGMRRLGYERNPKRCKEKWENINKYFKKVKESNKKRPEDAKTCPYFHELDALYQRKVHSSQGSRLDIRSDDAPTNEAVKGGGDDPEQPKNGGPNDGEETESSKKPEDTVKETDRRPDQQQQQRARAVDLGDDKANDARDHGNLERDENVEELDDDEDDDDDDEDTEEERKTAYKIEYQQERQNAGTPNGSGSGSTPSFATMVQ